MISLISLNIEMGKHTHRNLPFFKERSPDVICLQEVPSKVFEMYKEELEMYGIFGPMCILEDTEDEKGIAILSKYPLDHTDFFMYYGEATHIPLCVPDPALIHYILLRTECIKDGKKWSIATTHAPVSYPGSVVTPVQRKAHDVLQQKLFTYDDLIFCGDLNAPRGYQLFSELSSVFKDNIPVHYTTSIDGSLHRAGDLPFMVDALFTTEHYMAHNVELVGGLSDHYAVTAHIEKVHY